MEEGTFGNNLTQYCQDVVGMSRQSRLAVVDAIFGEAGQVSVPDVATFDAELTKVRNGVLCNVPDKRTSTTGIQVFHNGHLTVVEVSENTVKRTLGFKLI